jgi:tetratricopeptide (TPR) repeat protein
MKKLLLIRNIVLPLAAIVIMAVGFKFFTDYRYRKNIPQIPDNQTMTQPVKEQLMQAIKKTSRHPSAENIGTLGMVFHSGAFLKEASACYRLALKRDHSKWIWNYYLGCLNREMSESAGAISNFNEVMTKNKTLTQALYYVGEEYRKLGDLGKAEAIFKKISDQSNRMVPGSSGSRKDYFPLKTYADFQLARIYIDSGRSEMAEAILQDIIRDFPLFGPAYRLLGNIYTTKDDAEAANRYILKANDMTIYSNPIDTLTDKIILMSHSELILLKQIDEAVQRSYPEWALMLIDHSLKYLPDNKFLISKAIYAYLRSNQVEKAISLIPQHIYAYQDDLNEIKNTGYMFYQNGFYSQSEMYYNKAAQIKPGDSDVEFCLVLCKWKEGDKPKALQMISNQLEKSPLDVKILTSGVNALMYIGENERAREILSKLKRLAPANPDVMKIAGMFAVSDGNLVQAVEYYEASLKGNPGDLTVIRSLGNLLITRKMWNKSILFLKKALEKFPNDSFLLERLGTLLILCPETEKRNLPEGIEYARRAFNHIKSNPSTVVAAGKSLGAGYKLLGDKQNAFNVLNMTLSVARQNNFPATELATLEQMLNQVRN